MALYADLRNIEEDIIKCMNCGNCQAVCPIYKETLKESGVARGKIQLAKALIDGKLDYTDKMEEILSLCLTCKACAANCPCGVHPDKIILAARAAMVKKKGLHPLKRRIFGVLKKPKLFRLGMNIGSFLQGLGLKRIKGKNLASARFPLGLDMRRVIPPLASKSFIEQSRQIKKVDKPKYKAAFFAGCVNNYVYTDVAEAVVDVLLANNVEVIVPQDQHCCGIPILMHGDVDTAKEIAKYNLNQLGKEQVDFIITACGTCGGALKYHYVDLLKEEDGYNSLAHKISDRVYEVSEFMVEVLDFRKPGGKVEARVTYHDPCHLVRAKKVVAAQPREVLKSIPGIELVEMAKPDRCCGSAGSFSLTHYEMSGLIRDKKIDAVLAAKPTMVVTSCGACRMQLEDGLHQAGVDIPVRHVAQVLAEAYRNEDRGE
ncbi:MAG: (Fe-S)-binding protein [Bacillota bacterium]